MIVARLTVEHQVLVSLPNYSRHEATSLFTQLSAECTVLTRAARTLMRDRLRSS